MIFASISRHPRQLKILAVLIIAMFPAVVLALDPSAGTNPPLSQLIPEEKHLDPAWVKSFTERGEPQVFRGEELALALASGK